MPSTLFKIWSANQSSKKALMDLPFEGDRLFGTPLDDIIKDATGGRAHCSHSPKRGRSHAVGKGPSLLHTSGFFVRPVWRIKDHRPIKRLLRD